jgi:hypothetical protein
MTYTQTIDTDILAGALNLPPEFLHMQAVITIRPIKNVQKKKNKSGANVFKKVSLADLDAMYEGSITRALAGIITDEEKTLEEYRGERLAKYL